MDNEFVIVLITVPTLEIGKKIARTLVEEKIAACVNILPQIHSIYRWDNEVQAEDEFLLICKTRSDLVTPYLVDRVKSLHPYEVPEIISLPIVGGSHDYLKWIKEVTKE